jgi:hypothetical protein
MRVFIFVSRNSRKQRRSLQAAAPQDTETGRNVLEYNLISWSDSEKKGKYNEFLRNCNFFAHDTLIGDRTYSGLGLVDRILDNVKGLEVRTDWRTFNLSEESK